MDKKSKLELQKITDELEDAVHWQNLYGSALLTILTVLVSVTVANLDSISKSPVLHCSSTQLNCSSIVSTDASVRSICSSVNFSCQPSRTESEIINLLNGLIREFGRFFVLLIFSLLLFGGVMLHYENKKKTLRQKREKYVE